MYLCKYTDRNKKFASVDVIVYKKKCDKMASNKSANIFQEECCLHAITCQFFLKRCP